MSDLTLDEIRTVREWHMADGCPGEPCEIARLLDQAERQAAETPVDIACAECGDAVGDGSPAHCDLCYRALSVRLSDLEEEV